MPLKIEGDDGSFLWDAETGALKKRLAGNNGSVLSVYSPDGSLLATGGATSGAPNSVLLWGLTPSAHTSDGTRVHGG